MCSCADGSLRQEGHAQRQTSRHQTVESFDVEGVPSTLGAGEDSWSMFGEFVYRHHRFAQTTSVCTEQVIMPNFSEVHCRRETNKNQFRQLEESIIHD